ncbi:MAG: tRNA-binding protein [Nitrosopumilaceae archaeon]
MTNITYDDFAKLDLRIAKITSTEKIPGKSRIIKGVIDLGEERREVIIGGAEYYQPEELIGRTVVVIANLEPRKIAGFESNAMLLAADVNDKPFWLTVKEDVPLGTKIKLPFVINQILRFVIILLFLVITFPGLSIFCGSK